MATESSEAPYRGLALERRSLSPSTTSIEVPSRTLVSWTGLITSAVGGGSYLIHRMLTRARGRPARDFLLSLDSSAQLRACVLRIKGPNEDGLAAYRHTSKVRNTTEMSGEIPVPYRCAMSFD